MDATEKDIYQIVEKFYERLSWEPEFRGISSLFSEEVDWRLAADNETIPWAGEKFKNEEIKAVFNQMADMIEVMPFHKKKIFYDKEEAVSIGKHFIKIKSTGEVIDCEFSAHFKVREGKIIYYHLLLDNHQLQQALKNKTN